MNSPFIDERSGPLSLVFWLLIASTLLAILALEPRLESLYQTETARMSGWYSAVHTPTNAFLFWHAGIFAHVPEGVGQLLHHLLNLIVFISGTFCLASFTGTYPRVTRGSIALAVTVVIVFFFGWDPILWSILAWIPFLSALLYKALCTTTSERLYGAICFFIVCATVHSAFQLSIIPICLSVLLALLLKALLQPRFPVLRGRRDLLLVMALPIPWLVFAFLAPAPVFPDYSPLGHVVPDDGLPGNILPLFGPTPPIPVINHLIVRDMCGGLATGLALAFLLFCRFPSHKLTACIVAFPALALLDVAAPEWISQIAPLATLERVVPWLFFYPFVFPVLAFCLLLFGMIVVLKASSVHGIFLRLFGTTAFLCLVLVDRPLEARAGILYSNETSQLYEELTSFSADPEFTQYVQQVLVSPSHAVLKKTGLWPLRIREIIQHWSFSSLLHEKPIISTSHIGLEPTAHMHDRDIATRWSSGGGAQRGTEWIYLYLPEPQTIHGIELVTGPFHTDFARGVRIATGTHCKETIRSPAEVDLSTVVSISDWDGSLAMTREGYPYFEGQGSGRVYFDSPQHVRCFLIEQISIVPGFDWSVAEIKTLLYPQ